MIIFISGDELCVVLSSPFQYRDRHTATGAFWKRISPSNGNGAFQGSDTGRDLQCPEKLPVMSNLRRKILLWAKGFGDTLYVILEGTVKSLKAHHDWIWRWSRNRKKQGFHPAQCLPACCFRRNCSSGGYEKDATIKAVTDCIFYEIKKDDFYELAREDYKLGYRSSSTWPELLVPDWESWWGYD